jgi:hypothetical protein
MALPRSWNIGMLETGKALTFLPPLFHYSKIPSFQLVSEAKQDKESNGNDPGSEKVNRAGQQR